MVVTMKKNKRNTYPFLRILRKETKRKGDSLTEKEEDDLLILIYKSL